MDAATAPSVGVGTHRRFLTLIESALPPDRINHEPGGNWISVGGRQQSPQQGWKLHVSATVLSAEEVLLCALPLLAAEEASFKVATPAALLNLNHGLNGLSQVGKFMTVYPRDEAQAVRLAVALDEATAGLPGPAVPSDRPLRPGSLVHYRYGGFAHLLAQTSDRGVQSVIFGPEGEVVPDERVPYYRAPPWAVDPFVTAGVTAAQQLKAQIGGRYLITATLHASARGSVHTGLDTTTLEPCVLKRAARDGVVGLGSPDAQERLRAEFEALSTLGPEGLAPAVSALIEQDGDLYLVMEDVAGETLVEHVGARRRRGTGLDPQEIIAWGRELATALQRVHDRGYLLCDLKPANIMVEPDGRLRLLDFDAVRRLDSAVPGLVGTRGYTAPEHLDGSVSGVEADVYSLGAVLYFLATGAEAWQAPDAQNLLQRPIALLNPDVPPALERAISACLHPDPAARPRSMLGVDALLAVAREGRRRRRAVREEPAGDPLEEARRLGDSICRAGRLDPGGLSWPAPLGVEAAPPLRSLYDGSAGTVLALGALAETLGRQEHREALTEGARWLSNAPALRGDPAPGLYDGEAGVALALLLAGKTLGDETLIRRAASLSRSVAAQPHRRLDLISGTAGRLRCHLAIWSVTGEGEALRAAIDAGEALIEAAEPAGEGLRWVDDLPIVLPQDRPADGSPPVYLGYAHGTAGIGDVLLDLWEATGEDRFRQAAEGAARRLAQLAVPALDDASGTDWPRTEGGPLSGAFWCHGAAGIGRFFLHAARVDLLAQAEELAHRAALTVEGATRAAAPTLCHGLAGNLSFLLEMHRQTGDQSYLAAARTFGRLLRCWQVERDGALVCAGDEPTIFSPSYMVGYAGVAVSLLRLAVPGDLPDLAPSSCPHGESNHG